MLTKMGPFIWKNIWRNKRRSVLIILGIGVAVFVYATLNAAVNGLTFPIQGTASSQILNVREAGRANVLASKLPEIYVDRVRSIDGVQAAAGVLTDIAVIGTASVHIFLRGVQPDEYRLVEDFIVDDVAWENFRSDRRAILIGHRLRSQLGWNIGDQIDLGALEIRAVIAGIIPPQGIDLENHLLIHQGYFQNNRGVEGQISYVLVRPEPLASPSKLSQLIDDTFAYSAITTKTASAQEFAEEIVNDFLDFLVYLKVMGIIAVLITMLAAANGLAMSVRERTCEIGMLKAIGFKPSLICQMVLAESMLLAIVGGFVGLGVAWTIVGTGGTAVEVLALDGAILTVGAALALGVGILGGIVPAINAARLKTIDCLHVVG
jgi:putative ABC transport system permease protein